ncbi:uncharacterized protein [Ambystoma mexicanum]|uniref:uncharacterized protein isoform X3 n=1 Tax=Ambystoma mexicanum TaxID=8296 RepID=UPI0037E8D8ED
MPLRLNDVYLLGGTPTCLGRGSRRQEHSTPYTGSCTNSGSLNTNWLNHPILDSKVPSSNGIIKTSVLGLSDASLQASVCQPNHLCPSKKNPVKHLTQSRSFKIFEKKSQLGPVNPVRICSKIKATHAK